MPDRHSVASRGFGGLAFGRESVKSNAGFGGQMGGLSRRATNVDGHDFEAIRKMTIGLNELKREKEMNDKLDGVLIEGTTYQKILYELVEKSWFKGFVQCCVVVNISFLIANNVESCRPFLQQYTNWLDLIECFFVAVYTVEVLLKLYVYGLRNFMKEGWDKLDLILVIISFVDLICNARAESSGDQVANASNLAKSSKMLRILRSARICRLIKTMKMMGRLEIYISTLHNAFTEIMPILQLFMSFLVMYSCLFCSLFGRILPRRFGNIPLTFFTLIQLLTLDDWFEILQEGSTFRYDSLKQASGLHDINFLLLFLLVFYIFSMTFIMLNLIIAVLVDNFQQGFEKEKYKDASEEEEQRQILDQIDNMDEDVNEDLNENSNHLNKDEDDEEEEFKQFFIDEEPTELLLKQWYYRLLPAIEKQMFFFNDQMATYERIVDEAINQSDDLYHMTQ